jgi:1,5-anhydro-D-fructose reductase (1,5-anhydro-D-mannitol-forming)
MIRFGIVGFGLHAEKRMMPAFALSKKCKVTALSRRTVEKAEQSSRQWKIPLAFDSAAELARSPKVDAVFVTTPNNGHLPDVLAAVAAGKPVLCEKPLAMNAAECRQMVETARKAKVPLGVAHVFRFEESVLRLRERVAAGEIGKPLFARSEFHFFADASHPRLWLHDLRVAGGGPIADIGVHCVDSLRFVLQDEVVRVSTRGAHDELSGEMEAAAALMLEFSRGTLATALVSYRAEYRTPFEVIGPTGTLGGDHFLNVEQPIALELHRGGKVVESETVSNNLAYVRMVDAFAEAMERKTEYSIPGEEGWQNQEILDAAYRSMHSGKAEEVPRVRRG